MSVPGCISSGVRPILYQPAMRITVTPSRNLGVLPDPRIAINQTSNLNSADHSSIIDKRAVRGINAAQSYAASRTSI